MGALFISHSSADNALAAELVAVLAAQGHRSVFLDFDPQAGIPAGRDWEQELYAQLRACQAVVALCSEHSMASPWCFAEITHARALGKPIFPVKTDTSAPWSLLQELQLTDLTQDRARGWQRLLQGLQAAGLDARSLFDWDPSRPPYPGLLAFQKADAAVYFGRGAAVQSTLETLNRLRRLGGPRLLLVLGASGSGKSSLVRAGVLPRLERDTAAWVVVPPFRPLSRPLDSMAVALAGLPGAEDGASLRAMLAADPSTAAGWRAVVNRLRVSAGPEASIVVTVDQFEEALDTNAAPDDEKSAFLRLLRSIADETDGPLFVLATLRSDFLGAFQTHPLLRGVAYEPIHLPQISRGEVAQVIEGPAQVAGLRLESGLSQAMVADTATDDALPLLAFTLRELFDRFGKAGGQGAELAVAQYRDQLGGLQGALARAAEALCREAPSGGLPAARSGDLEALRRALLKLVRIDGEARFVRSPCPWNELPREAHTLLERFVQARLLVSRSGDGGERVLEVAHEALFRSWDRLAAWLAADREFLLWRERMHAASMLWRDNQRDPSLDLRGPVLDEARRWRAERADDLGELAREFIDASVAAHEAAQVARDRRRRRLVASMAGAVVVFGLLAAAAAWQWREANQERRMAVARQLGAQGDVAYDRGEWQRGLLLTLHSLQSAWTADAHAALVQRLDSLARPQPSPGWKPHPGPIRAMALSPDGRWLATAGQRHLQVQAAGGEVRDLESRNGHDYLHALAFSGDGKWLAASCDEQAVCIYDTTQWKPRRLPDARGVVTAITFGSNDTLLATISRGEKVVRTFAMPAAEEAEPIDTGEEAPEGISLSRDGRWLAVSKRSGLEIREPASGKLLGQIASARPGALLFSDTSPLLAAAHGGLPIPFSLEATDQGLFQIQTYVAFNAGQAPGRDPFAAVAIHADRFHIAASDSASGARIARLARDAVPSLAPGPAGALVFTADGRLLVGGRDGQITAWDPDDKALWRLTHAGKVHAVALSADGRTLATASEGNTVRLIDAAAGGEIRSLPLACDPGSLAFSADGRWLSAVQEEKLWLVDTASGRVIGPFEHEARVTSVRFESDGQRVATSTLWDGDIRYAVRRPTKQRVWDIATGRELGWRFDIEGDRKRTQTVAAKKSLDAVKAADGGDGALAAASSTWVEAYGTDDLNFYPRLIQPDLTWLSSKTTAGLALIDAALERAKRADGDLGDDNRFAISADGRLLASTAGKEARLWPLRFEELQTQACQRLQRNLSCAEWREARGAAPYTKACAQLAEPADAAECTAAAGR
ncbi:TIR domain-containing protein [Variovorax sp. J22P240]|uniref:nSTAND1 domain-containing NTPase n=1 Tax=Variovorax sp. J22P240 TaxID=3053514 RepID=UPI002575F08B|nr:TIR domain-containing protein [Variovorax sp. J22P240]MDM0001797.1 TIR domain-containing protein [Variovorax sp. J22P240]